MVIKNKLKSFNSSIHSKQRLMITALIVVVLTSMSVGYAFYHEELSMDSTLVLEAPLEIRIYDAVVASSTSATDKGSTMTFEETTDGMKLVVDTTVHFAAANWGATRPTITYTYRIVNLSHHAYTFSDMTYSSEITNGTANIGDPVITGITSGQVIQPGEDITFNASVTMGSILGISYEKDAIIHIELIFTEGEATTNIGSVNGTVSETSLLLEDGMAEVDVSLLNIYGYGIDYSITSSNANVLLVDENGNETTYTGLLDDGSYATHHVYLKVKDGTDTSNGVETTLSCVLTNGESFIIDTLTLSEDPNPKYSDVTVTYSIENDLESMDTYYLTFKVTNNRSTDIGEYTAYLYLDDEMNIKEIVNDTASVIYDSDNNIIKLSSNIKGTDTHQGIAAGETVEFDKITIRMDQTDLIITKTEVLRDGEVFTTGYSYTTE